VVLALDATMGARVEAYVRFDLLPRREPLAFSLGSMIVGKRDG